MSDLSYAGADVDADAHSGTPGTAAAAATPARRDVVLWSIAGCAGVAAVVSPFLGQRVPTVAFTALMLAYAGVDGARRYGPRTLAVLFAWAVLISNLMENLSIETGFPFGTYHHTTGPKVFEVPVAVGPTYFAIGYISWQVAESLLRPRGSESRRNADRWIVPAVAAFLATMYDATIDPVASTVMGLWIWPHGGGYFGVPFSNFLGWLLTVYVFLAVFELEVTRRGRRRLPESGPAPASGSGADRRAAVLIYLSMGAVPVFGYLAALGTPDRMAADGSGARWSVHGVYEGCMVAGIFAVCFAGLSALAVHRRR